MPRWTTNVTWTRMPANATAYDTYKKTGSAIAVDILLPETQSRATLAAG
jgi:hypothetical protein